MSDILPGASSQLVSTVRNLPFSKDDLTYVLTTPSRGNRERQVLWMIDFLQRVLQMAGKGEVLPIETVATQYVDHINALTNAVAFLGFCANSARFEHIQTGVFRKNCHSIASALAIIPVPADYPEGSEIKSGPGMLSSPFYPLPGMLYAGHFKKREIERLAQDIAAAYAHFRALFGNTRNVGNLAGCTSTARPSVPGQAAGVWYGTVSNPTLAKIDFDLDRIIASLTLPLASAFRDMSCSPLASGCEYYAVEHGAPETVGSAPYLIPTSSPLSKFSVNSEAVKAFGSLAMTVVDQHTNEGQVTRLIPPDPTSTFRTRTVNLQSLDSAINGTSIDVSALNALAPFLCLFGNAIDVGFTDVPVSGEHGPITTILTDSGRNPVANGQPRVFRHVGRFDEKFKTNARFNELCANFGLVPIVGRAGSRQFTLVAFDDSRTRDTSEGKVQEDLFGQAGSFESESFSCPGSGIDLQPFLENRCFGLSGHVINHARMHAEHQNPSSTDVGTFWPPRVLPLAFRPDEYDSTLLGTPLMTIAFLLRKADPSMNLLPQHTLEYSHLTSRSEVFRRRRFFLHPLSEAISSLYLLVSNHIGMASNMFLPSDVYAYDHPQMTPTHFRGALVEHEHDIGNVTETLEGNTSLLQWTLNAVAAFSSAFAEAPFTTRGCIGANIPTNGSTRTTARLHVFSKAVNVGAVLTTEALVSCEHVHAQLATLALLRVRSIADSNFTFNRIPHASLSEVTHTSLGTVNPFSVSVQFPGTPVSQSYTPTSSSIYDLLTPDALHPAIGLSDVPAEIVLCDQPDLPRVVVTVPTNAPGNRTGRLITVSHDGKSVTIPTDIAGQSRKIGVHRRIHARAAGSTPYLIPYLTVGYDKRGFRLPGVSIPALASSLSPISAFLRRPISSLLFSLFDERIGMHSGKARGLVTFIMQRALLNGKKLPFLMRSIAIFRDQSLEQSTTRALVSEAHWMGITPSMTVPAALRSDLDTLLPTSVADWNQSPHFEFCFLDLSQNPPTLSVQRCEAFTRLLHRYSGRDLTLMNPDGWAPALLTWTNLYDVLMPSINTNNDISTAVKSLEVYTAALAGDFPSFKVSTQVTSPSPLPTPKEKKGKEKEKTPVMPKPTTTNTVPVSKEDSSGPASIPPTDGPPAVNPPVVG